LSRRNLEEQIDMVRVFEVGKPDSLAVVIVKEARDRLNIQRGDKFNLKIDRRGRIILEPLSQSNR